MAKNELAVIDNFELSSNTDIMEALIEELGEDAKIPYDRVKIPSGGTTAFEVPSDDPDNPDIEKEIEGIIVYAQKINAYWKDAYSGDNTSPDCSSNDGKVGVEFETGEIHKCVDCPFNEFKSGPNGVGKACKNMRRLYIIRTGCTLPIVLTLPPTSLRAYEDYVGRQIVTKGLRTHFVITKISLKKAQSKDGITYSTAQFTKVGRVPDEMKPELTAYYNSMKTNVSSMAIDDDDYDMPSNQTSKNNQDNEDEFEDVDIENGEIPNFEDVGSDA